MYVLSLPLQDSQAAAAHSCNTHLGLLRLHSNWRRLFPGEPAFVNRQGRPRLETVGLKGGDGTPHTPQRLKGSGQTWGTLVDNKARGSGAPLHQGRSQLGLHISIAPIAIVTTGKLKIWCQEFESVSSMYWVFKISSVLSVY